jgi:hypothetical protein
LFDHQGRGQHGRCRAKDPQQPQVYSPQDIHCGLRVRCPDWLRVRHGLPATDGQGCSSCMIWAARARTVSACASIMHHLMRGAGPEAVDHLVAVTGQPHSLRAIGLVARTGLHVSLAVDVVATPTDEGIEAAWHDPAGSIAQRVAGQHTHGQSELPAAMTTRPVASASGSRCSGMSPSCSFLQTRWVASVSALSGEGGWLAGEPGEVLRIG